jgi:hypothetical protein
MKMRKKYTVYIHIQCTVQTKHVHTHTVNSNTQHVHAHTYCVQYNTTCTYTVCDNCPNTTGLNVQ